MHVLDLFAETTLEEEAVFLAKQSMKETADVTDYNPTSQGGTRKELVAKYHQTKDPKDAEAARRAGATQQELQGVAEGSDILKVGTSVRVPHRGKMVPGKIVRYDSGKGGYSPAYVVDIGEYESKIVPVHNVKQGVAEGFGRYNVTIPSNLLRKIQQIFPKDSVDDIGEWYASAEEYDQPLTVDEYANWRKQGVAEGAIPEDMFRTKAEVENPVDSVKLDIPLLIRIMEYAREDAKTDLDLHDMAERLISIGRSGNTLSMRDYDRIVGKEARPMLTNKQ